MDLGGEIGPAKVLLLSLRCGPPHVHRGIVCLDGGSPGSGGVRAAVEPSKGPGPPGRASPPHHVETQAGNAYGREAAIRIAGARSETPGFVARRDKSVF